MVFITISASPFNSKSMSSTMFGCFMVRVNSTSRNATLWSSILWQVIRFNANRRLVEEFSTKSIKLKPLQSNQNGNAWVNSEIVRFFHLNKEIVKIWCDVASPSLACLASPSSCQNENTIYPCAMRSLTTYLTPPIVTVSLEHQHPILKMIAQPRLFILIFLLLLLFVLGANELCLVALLLLLSNWFVIDLYFYCRFISLIHFANTLAIQLNCRFFPRIHRHMLTHNKAKKAPI